MKRLNVFSSRYLENMVNNTVRKDDWSWEPADKRIKDAYYSNEIRMGTYDSTYAMETDSYTDDCQAEDILMAV